MATAAALVATTARFSDGQVDDHDAIATANDAVRAEVLRLAEADGPAYGRVLEAMRAHHGSEDARREAIATALEAACDVPVAIIGRAAHVGELAHRLAVEGNPNLRADALAGLHLAVAAARSSLGMVQANTDAGDLDRERLARLRRDVAAIAALLQDAGRQVVDD